MNDDRIIPAEALTAEAFAPWGEVLADAGIEPGVTLVDLDMARVDDARARVPAWRHDPVVWGP